MTWRVQWRERTPNGDPSTVIHEDGYDPSGVIFKVTSLLGKGPLPCWIAVEDLESTHKGSSVERPKPHKQAKK